MKKYLLPVSLALGCTFNFLFWNKDPGISFPLFINLCLVSGYALLAPFEKKPAKTNYLLLIPALFFSIMFVVRREPLTSFLNFAVTLFSMALLAATYLNTQWTRFTLVEYVGAFFNFVGGVISLPWMHRKTHMDENRPESGGRKIIPILRGIGIALPVWLVFTALLYSADLVFAHRMDAFLLSLKLGDPAEFTMRLILTLFVAYVFYGAVLYAADRSGNPINLQKKRVFTPFLEITEAGIVLAGVILVFSLFVIIQFQYFFSGQANINIEGFTYSEYARRGFGELVIVAVLSIVLIKSLNSFTKKESPHSQRILRVLNVALVALVLVILASAFQRLGLYESAYGFTRLRTYSHVFMVWLGIYMVAIVVMEIFQHAELFATTTLVMILGFSLTINFLNIDGFIVTKNIYRSMRGEPFDSSYLAGLSSDAVSVMAEHFNDPALPAKLREDVGASLACFKELSFNESLEKQPWPSFHFSDRAAIAELTKLSEELSAYKISDEAWPIVVKSPSGFEYPCPGYAGID